MEEQAEKYNMNQFRIIGYYICGVEDTPNWLTGISRQILSVCGCIGERGGTDHDRI